MTHFATIKGDCAEAFLQVLEAMDAEARAQVGPHFLFEVRVGGRTWQKYNPIDFDDLADLAVTICSGKYTPQGEVYELQAFDTVTPAGLPRVLLSSGRIDGGTKPAPWYKNTVPLVLASLTLAAAVGAAGAVVVLKKKRR